MSEQNGRGTARLVDELAEVAERYGVKVRREKILREVGYRARGGACRLRETDLVIIEREQSAIEQLEILTAALRDRDLEAVYLSPAARRLLQANPEQG